MKKMCIIAVMSWSTLSFAATATKILCHKPLKQSVGADVIGEIDIEQSKSVKNKQLITSGKVFIKAHRKAGLLTINTDIIAGQSAGATKYLLFTNDQRVHSIIIDGLRSGESVVKLNLNKTLVDFAMDCTQAPRIPKSKS